MPPRYTAGSRNDARRSYSGRGSTNTRRSIVLTHAAVRRVSSAAARWIPSTILQPELVLVVGSKSSGGANAGSAADVSARP